MIPAAVRAEQVRTLYRHSGAVLATNVVSSWVVAVLLWATVSSALLLAFIGTTGLLCAARFVLYRRYWRAAPDPTDSDRWGLRFTVGSALSGATWGAGAFVLFSRGGPMAELILPFVVGGMTAAAAGTTSAYLPAFLAFMLPSVTGLALGALDAGAAAHVGMSTLLLVYAVGLSFVASRNNRALVEAFRFRFENQALLEEVSRVRVHLEETNRSLEERVAERSTAFERQTDVLRDAQRLESIGRLAGGVAHDFNNLLLVVLANAEGALDDPRLAEGLRGPVGEIRDAAGRGAELVKQLLLVGRRQSMRPETLDLNQAVTRSQRLLVRLIGEHITLDVALHPTPLFVHVDPTQIEQVIINLAANARDAMPSGGTLRIETAASELDAAEHGAHAMLLVRDTGAGMDTQTRIHLFEPFFTTKEVGKGTGLGLATVYGVVEQSGGTIRVESTLDLGSSFFVYLPLVGPPVAEVRAAPASDAPPARAGTVLLVEDDPSVRVVTQRLLRRGGYDVLAAENATHALKLASEHAGPIHVLVSDVVMPGLSGPELDERLRATRPGLCTLFMSGYSRDVVMPVSDEAHGRAYVDKPFSQEQFMRRVAALMSRSTAADRSP